MGRPDFSVLESNFLEDFDVHLQKFYKIVIGKEIGFKFKSYAEDIRGILRELVLHYRKEYKDKASIKLRFETRKRRCAYILKNSPLFAYTVAFHFTELFSQNQLILMRPFRERQLNLCCLGGGPAPELVGFVKVLALLYSSTGNPEPLELKVTIVDIEEKWKTTCEYVLECLKMDTTVIGVERIAIDFNFVKADLTEPFDEDLKDVINKADIVTMVYFLSTVNGGTNTEESFQMIKKIMDVIQMDSILFFLNNATDVHFQQMDKAALEMGDMKIIYGPCLEDFRHLSLKSVEKFLQIYEEYFDLQNCMSHGFMSYCAWRKVNFKIVINEVEKEKREKRLLLQKNNEYLTRKMKNYRRSLYELIKNRKRLEELKISKESGKIETKHSSELTHKSNESFQKIVKDNANNIVENEFESDNCLNQRSRNRENFEMGQSGVTGLAHKGDIRTLEEGDESIRESRREHKEYDITNEPNLPNTTNFQHFEEDKSIKVTANEKEPHCEENIMVCEGKNEGTNLMSNVTENVKEISEEKQMNCSLNGDEGGQSDTNETKEGRKIEFKEKAIINDVNIQYEKYENRTKTEKERGNTFISEDNRGEGSVKRDPVTINESKGISKPKAPKNPLQKPRGLKPKDNVSSSQQEETHRYGQHDNTITYEQNTKQEKGKEESESDGKKMTITDTQDKNKDTLKSLDSQPPTYTDQDENKKSNIHSSYNEPVRKATLSVENEALKNKPSVPTAPQKKPRELKKSSAPCLKSHLDDNND